MNITLKRLGTPGCYFANVNGSRVSLDRIGDRTYVAVDGKLVGDYDGFREARRAVVEYFEPEFEPVPEPEPEVKGPKRDEKGRFIKAA